jgi:hypothetical protein
MHLKQKQSSKWHYLKYRTSDYFIQEIFQGFDFKYLAILTSSFE